MGPRRLNLGQEDQPVDPVVMPEEGAFSQPPSRPWETAPPDTGSPVGDAIGRIVVGFGDGVARILRGITVVSPHVPAGAVGAPGTQGCPSSACPVLQMGPAGQYVAICVPCPPPTQTTVNQITSAPWFWPAVLIAAVAVLGGRRR